MTDVMTIAPARLFTKVELQLASWCNRTCAFCPSGTFPVPKTFMSDQVAERVAGELRDVGFSGALGFHLMSEPFLYKRFEEIVALFRRHLPNAYLYVHTNGDAINDFERAPRLFAAGLNQLWMNCYDSSEQFERRNAAILGLTRRHPDIWYWNKWLCEPSTARHRWKVIRLRAFFGGGFTLRNWGGSVANSHDERLEFPLKMECDRVVDALHVNYLGQVVLCNNDWKFEVVAGDLMKEDVRSLWTSSPVLEKYRAHLARRDRSLPLCRGCDNGYPRRREPPFPPADGLARARRVWAFGRRLAWRAYTKARRLSAGHGTGRA
jgi:MoaA/NifB/PqqE/SkfB family radical SAM enzyme